MIGRSSFRRLRSVGWHINRLGGWSVINLARALPWLAPNSSGPYAARAELTLQSAKQTLPSLLRLSRTLGAPSVKIETVDEFEARFPPASRGAIAAETFRRHDSDKSTKHDYDRVYAVLLEDCAPVGKILEIGLGTNNDDVVSTMGPKGVPGASLRAFRELCPNAAIFGADVDRRILFNEDQIKTFFVDQTAPDSFEELGEAVGDVFDLMIDDGLQTPHANLNALTFFLGRLRPGGWAVVEDVSPDAASLWRLVIGLLPAAYQGHVVKTRISLMVAIKHVA